MRTFRIDYEMFSETLPDEFFPKRSQLVDVGPLWAAALALGGGAPLPASGRASVFVSISIRGG